MAKSYRYDPDDYSGEHTTRLTKKELKRQRKERHKKDERLNELMEVEDNA